MKESKQKIALTEAVFYILLSLYTPLHGYGIMQNVKRLSKDRVELGAGTLYGAINTLLEKQWIEPVVRDQNSRRKEYIITVVGKEMVKNEIDRLEELFENGNAVIKENQ